MLRNMRIKHKFILIMALLVAGVSILYFLSTSTVSETSIGSTAYNNIVSSKDLTADILPPPLYIIESYAEMLGMLSREDSGQIENLARVVQGKRDDFETSRRKWLEALPNDRIRSVLEKDVCGTAERIYDLFDSKALPLARKGDLAQAKLVVTGEIVPLFLKHREGVENLASLLDEYVKSAEKSGKETVSQRTNFMIAGFAVVILFVVSFFTLLSVDFTRAFAACLRFAKEVSTGMMNATINNARRDDFGELADTLTVMLDRLRSSIALAEDKASQAETEMDKSRAAIEEAQQARVAEQEKSDRMLSGARHLETVVEVVTSASEELSAQIEQSSRGAEFQSRRVIETATAIEQMNAAVLEVAGNASEAAGTSEQAKLKAQEGARVVERVVRGIGDVRDASLGLKDDMTALGKQAEGIGQVMNVISDIADQTNLLALNAAIEAARAGDAGRGFAVVADEVRKLAEKTMQATKEVGEAITGIQDGTRLNIAHVDDAARKIEEATELAGKSGEALKEIVSLVDRTTDQVRSIASASEEQSATSGEIHRSIEDISRISHETSDAMRQSAQAVHGLASQAHTLQGLVLEMRGDSSDGGDGLKGRGPAGLPGSRRH